MPDEFKHDVFLSHSAQDKAVVRRSSLSASNGERAGVRCRSLHSLRKDGLKVWFDEWVLDPEVPLAHRMGEGPGERAAHAFGSDWAQLLTYSQLSTFNSQPTAAPLNKERRFLPLRLDDALPKCLGTCDWPRIQRPSRI